MSDEVRVRTLEDADAIAKSVLINLEQVERRVRYIEKQLDTRATPWWRRVIFRIDGWPSWPFVTQRPRWRPWRRWYCS